MSQASHDTEQVKADESSPPSSPLSSSSVASLSIEEKSPSSSPSNSPSSFSSSLSPSSSCSPSSSSSSSSSASSSCVSPDKLRESEEHKAIGNKEFSNHHYAAALAAYTKAIECNDRNPIYYSNRSICHVRLENYGAAIEDATRALELDPSFIKAYYRRGAARIGLARYRDALNDFKQVVKIVPTDKDALNKLNQCQKAVRAEAFNAAIANERSKPPSESADYKQISVEDSYDGPRLEEDGNVTDAFIKQLIDHFRAQKKLHRRYLYQILLQVIPLLKSLPTLQDIDIPEGTKFTVCGDVHGQFYDLLNIFELNGVPSESNPYLFNGDFVDRGSFSLEIITLFFALKLRFPSCFHMTRGNHETVNMNAIYGFQGEVGAKADAKAFELFSEAFEWLPLAVVLNHKVLVLHGGLFSKDGVKLDDIRKIERNQQPPETGLMSELLWSDPQPLPGRAPSKRGVGLSFGPDVTRRFLADNGLTMLVRSHEVKEEGYEVEADGQLVTIFSAPNYCDSMGNKGAFITFGADCKPNFTQFTAVPHPKIVPMAYASQMMRAMSMG